MHERRGAIGADQLDAAVEEQIAEQRRKYADIDEAQETLAVEDHRAPGGNLRSHRRNQQQRAHAHDGREKRQRMHRRPLAQHRRIEAVDQQGDDEPQVALVEIDADESRKAAVADNDDHAGERHADAACLPQRETIAEQRKGPQRDAQRPDRLQQQSIDRRRVLQAVIGHRVVGGDAGEREQRHQTGVLADHRPIAREMPGGKRQQHHKGAAPANERERDRRNMSDDEAAQNRIAGPEQRGEREQQIRLVEQPAASAACAGVTRPRHDEFPGSGSRGSEELALDRTAHDQCRDRMTDPVTTADNPRSQLGRRAFRKWHPFSVRRPDPAKIDRETNDLTRSRRAREPFCLASNGIIHYPRHSAAAVIPSMRALRGLLGTIPHGKCCRGRLPVGRRG